MALYRNLGFRLMALRRRRASVDTSGPTITFTFTSQADAPTVTFTFDSE